MPRSFAPTGFAPPHVRPRRGSDRLPVGVALPIILALSTLAWLGLIWMGHFLLAP